MEGMGQFPDNYFNLAIIDIPYQRGGAITNGGTWAKKRPTNGYKWDILPGQKYFDELFRLSKNQIMWGGNYFTDRLPISRAWIVWDKITEGFTAISNELAWTSFDRKIEIYKRPHGKDRGFMNKDGGNIHPTEKPVHLYRWILKNYARAGWKILDTHVGSGSSLIACEREGFQYVGFEIDPDYYKAAMKRIKRERQQLTLALQ